VLSSQIVVTGYHLVSTGLGSNHAIKPDHLNVTSNQNRY